MSVYRCEWCGRFYSSPLPEPSACDSHILEHNARMERQIQRFNAKLFGLPVRLDSSMPRNQVRFEDKHGRVVGAFEVNE